MPAHAIDLTTRTFHFHSFGNKASTALLVASILNGDVAGTLVNFGKLPQGVIPTEVRAYCPAGAPVTISLTLGLKSVAGVNQDDADYFFAATVLAAGGLVIRKSNPVAPFLLAQEMYVQGTTGAATANGTTTITVEVDYLTIGHL